MSEPSVREAVDRLHKRWGLSKGGYLTIFDWMEVIKALENDKQQKPVAWLCQTDCVGKTGFIIRDKKKVDDFMQMYNDGLDCTATAIPMCEFSDEYKAGLKDAANVCEEKVEEFKDGGGLFCGQAIVAAKACAKAIIKKMREKV